jgi:hypothetical protein
MHVSIFLDALGFFGILLRTEIYASITSAFTILPQCLHFLKH